MATKYIPNQIQGIPSASRINDNLTSIQDELDSKLDRRAVADNSLLDDLDVNGFRINNVADSAQGQDGTTRNDLERFYNEKIVEAEAGIEGLLALFGREESYILGYNSFQITSVNTNVTVTAGGFWAPSEPTYQFRSVVGDVILDITGFSDGTYSLQLDSNQEYVFASEYDNQDVTVAVITVVDEAMTAVTYPNATLMLPIDAINALDSIEYGTSYAQLGDRFEVIEDELENARGSPVYGYSSTLEERIDQPELEIDAARDSAENATNYDSLDLRLEDIEETANVTDDALTEYQDEQIGGLSAQDGDGAVVAFNIPHTLGVVPSSISVTQANAVSAAEHWVGVDATNITVTFSVAPVVGTGNVTFYWTARV